MARYHQLLNSLKGPVFFIDTNLKFEFVNQSFCQITGYAQSECMNYSFESIIKNSSRKQITEAFHHANESEPITISGIPILKKDGEQFIVDILIFPEIEKGKFIGYSGYFNEVSVELSTSGQDIIHSDMLKIKEKYKSLFNLTFEGIIIHDHGITLDANEAFIKMMDYSREEIIGKNIVELCVLPEYHQRVFDAMKNKTSDPYEVLARRKDGVVIHTEVESHQIKLDNRDVRVTAIRNISDRKNAENDLKESKERYKLLSNITFEGIFLHDKGVIIDANESLSKMVGYELEEIIGKNIIQMVVLPEYHQRVAAALQNEETTPYIVKVRRKNGSEFYAEVEAGMVNHKGDLLRVTAARDVTWRVEAERKLRENEEELDTFFSQSGDGFFIMNLDEPAMWNPENENEDLLNTIMANMYLTKINDAMIKQYNTKESQLKDFTLADFFYWNDLYAKNCTRELLDKGSVQFEMAEPRFDNNIMWIEGNYLVLYDESGKVRGCCGVRREISDRKKAEEEIKKHNEELRKTNQELDNFVYKVSHDLKAPIASTKGLINIALLEKEKDRIHTCLKLIQDSMDRLDSFILDILDYSRNARVEINPQLIDFNELIKDTLVHTKYLQHENKISVETHIKDKISFHSDKQRLVFIFNNLV